MKIKKKILFSVGILLANILTYLFLGFLGAYKDIKVVGSIFVFFGWVWLCMGHIIALYTIWRE